MCVEQKRSFPPLIWTIQAGSRSPSNVCGDSSLRLKVLTGLDVEISPWVGLLLLLLLRLLTTSRSLSSELLDEWAAFFALVLVSTAQRHFMTSMASSISLSATLAISAISSCADCPLLI